jgi:hypothetical protein
LLARVSSRHACSTVRGVRLADAGFAFFVVVFFIIVLRQPPIIERRSLCGLRLVESRLALIDSIIIGGQSQVSSVVRPISSSLLLSSAV